MDQQQRLEQLKQKYHSVLNLIQQSGVRLSHVHVQDNKLFLQGEAPSDQIKNKIWDEIKRTDASFSDLTCDLTVNPSLAAPQEISRGVGAGVGVPQPGETGQTYTVKAGDTLSKIAQQFYGNATQYMRIFEANRDLLKDPDRIQPGQKLKIPK